MDVPLPPAPPRFRFSDPATCTAELIAAGFDDPDVVEVPLAFRPRAAVDVLALTMCAVRLEMMIELQAELVARALKHPSPRLRAAIADRQDTRYYDYLPSLRHHLEVDYLRYERDLRKLLKLTGGREEAA